VRGYGGAQVDRMGGVGAWSVGNVARRPLAREGGAWGQGEMTRGRDETMPVR
jgi:hypothetical protein